MEVTPNPGFALLIASLLVLAAPRMLRAPTMAGAAALALWLLLGREFGAAAAMEQMGLTVVLLNLDALNQIFGIALLIALIVIAVYSSARRNRYEDSAILLLAGGAVSALFFGDWVFFVAAAELAGLAAAWVVLASPIEGAHRAGVRMLVWCGIEGLLFLVGVALHLSTGADRAAFGRMDGASIGGGFIFAALMIRVGAPMAHVWLKDGVSHASPTGAAALTAFSSMLGVYALARFFPGTPLLVPIGAAMILVGVFFAAAVDDLRAAAAYGQTAQTGVCVALVGVGSPLALAAMEGHAFAVIFAFMAIQMCLGGILERHGSARASDIEGIARAMPLSAMLLLLGGLAVSGAPGFAVYATLVPALEAMAQWDLRWGWVLVAGLSAALFVALALRPVLLVNRGPAKAKSMADAPYAMLLGTALAAFFCIAIGIAPQWLYGLTPTEMSLQPFALDRVARQLELLGAAGFVYLAFRLSGVAPREQALRLLDVDALYRGPLAGAGRWAGVVMLRLHGAWRQALGQVFMRLSRVTTAWVSGLDRPYSGRGSATVQLAALGAIIVLIALAARE
jgi:multicomponent Na+:H+ antiporter subunit D